MKADIYRNIGNLFSNLDRKVYSLRSRRSGATYGRVQGHMAYARCGPAEFVVSEAGRQRVVSRQAKEVHAVVRTDDLKLYVAEGDFGRYWQWNDSHEQFDPYPREAEFDPESEFMLAYMLENENAVRVTYNPYALKAFVDRSQRRPVLSAEEVLFFPQDVVAVNPTFGNLDPKV